MARGAREIHSPDLIDTSNDGILDFANLRVGSDEANIEIVGEREFKDNIEYEAFMHEPVVIALHQSTDKNAPRSVYAGVNGQSAWLPRGTKVRVPRFIVENLARSQAQAFKTQQNNDMRLDEAMDTTMTKAQDYGFSVVRDPNPKGEAWLARVSRQGR